jgi:hypothetical protein
MKTNKVFSMRQNIPLKQENVSSSFPRSLCHSIAPSSFPRPNDKFPQETHIVREGENPFMTHVYNLDSRIHGNDGTAFYYC